MSSNPDRKQECASLFKNFNYEKGAIYCGSVYDQFLCWGPTRAGKTVAQNCPDQRLSDTTQQAFRTCGETGQWLDRQLKQSSSDGWTNDTLCFPEEVKLLLNKDSEQDAQAKFEIARNSRYLEMFGYSFSLIALLISLFICRYFRYQLLLLYNNRTRIQKNLFAAMMLQVVTRLLIFLDQEGVGSNPADDGKSTKHVIEYMPKICDILYVIMEYGNSVLFHWMLIEGLYLNNLLTSPHKQNVQVRQENKHFVAIYIFGWCSPALPSLTWAVKTRLRSHKERVEKCWFGYSFKEDYWIIQGPRLAIIAINYVFLINILRVLIKKLRQSERNSTVIVSYRLLCLFDIKLEPRLLRILKALRAAFFLVPLLGLTKAFDIMEAPLSGPVWKFALWSYSVNFLRSFQGFFLALLYCFLNEEVKSIIGKRYQNYKAMRETRRRMRVMFRNNGSQATSLPAIDPSCYTQSGPRSISEETQRRFGYLQYVPIFPRPRYTKTLAEIYSSLPSVLAKSIQDAAMSLSEPCRLIDHKDRPSSLAIRDVGSQFLNYGEEKSDFIQMLDRATIEHVRPSSSYGRISPLIRQDIDIEMPARKYRLATSDSMRMMSIYTSENENIPFKKKTQRTESNLDQRQIETTTTIESGEGRSFMKKTQGTETNLNQSQTVSAHFETIAIIESGGGRSSNSKTQSTETKSSVIGNRPPPKLQEDYDSIEVFEDYMKTIIIGDGNRPSSITKEVISKSPSFERQAIPEPSQEETKTDKKQERRSSLTEESDTESLEYEQATSGASREETASSMDEYRSLSSTADYGRRSNPRRESYESINSA